MSPFCVLKTITMKPYPVRLLSKIESWARNEGQVSSLAIVGSYATGTQNEASDIDVVIVSKRKEILLRNREWTNLFGKKIKEEIENWGMLTSIRAWYAEWGEVEFGLVPSEWMRVPSDDGTSRVVNDGMKIVYDPKGELKKLKDHCNKKMQNKAADGTTRCSAFRSPSP